MIPLTIANTLNQSVKQRIEVEPAQTLKAAVQQHNLAQKAISISSIEKEKSSPTNPPKISEMRQSMLVFQKLLEERFLEIV